MRSADPARPWLSAGEGVMSAVRALPFPDDWEPIDVAPEYARYDLRVFPVVMAPHDGRGAKSPPLGYLWQARATSKVNHVVEDFDDAIYRYGAENIGVGWALGLDG